MADNQKAVSNNASSEYVIAAGVRAFIRDKAIFQDFDAQYAISELGKLRRVDPALWRSVG